MQLWICALKKKKKKYAIFIFIFFLPMAGIEIWSWKLEQLSETTK